MRWALMRGAVAVTAMVALAFLIPLAMTVKDMARDRAFTAAEQQAGSVAPLLAVTTDRDTLQRALAGAQGAADRVGVHLPGGAVVGTAHADAGTLATATHQARSFTAEVPGGYSVLQPVALGSGQLAVVEVFVPDSDLSRGVGTAWLVLSAVALVLVAASTVVADRLATRLVGAARHLGGAARAFGAGDTGVRVAAGEGPYELREVGQAFNMMAARIEQMLDAERELAADLSHRLRTPLTALRLNTAALGDDQLAEQTRQAVDQLEREVDRVIRAARRPASGRARTDAAEVLRDRMGFWSALAEDEGRRASLTGGTEPVTVPVERSELAAAMDVLLGNVFRHTPERTEFAVTLGAGPGLAAIVVDDAGPGIPDPDTALRRGHGAGGNGSTGLGLDIVRRVAESAGGALRIERSPTLGGTRIRVLVPTEPAAEPDRAGRHRRRQLR